MNKWYTRINRCGSPRLHVINMMRTVWVISDYPRGEWWIQVTDDNRGYYFSEEIIDKKWDLTKCTFKQTGDDFSKLCWISRPKLNQHIEKYMRIIYFIPWYYNKELLVSFLKDNMKLFEDKRAWNSWRKKIIK